VYNKKEICSVLGVNEKQLKDFRFKGKLSYTKVGDKYWYTQDDIDEFMAKHHRKAFA
jgi:predicted site-specific integrase-resolvase